MLTLFWEYFYEIILKSPYIFIIPLNIFLESTEGD